MIGPLQLKKSDVFLASFFKMMSSLDQTNLSQKLRSGVFTA